MTKLEDIIDVDELVDLGITAPLASTPFQENDLSPRIHSALVNWTGDTAPYDHLMPPVLSLASEMLDSPASVRLIHAILYGKRWHLTRDGQNGLATKYELERGIPPNETVRTQCAKGLKEIEQEKWISLGIFTEDDTDLVAKGKECFTWRDRGRVSSFEGDSLLHEKDGNPSIIWISHELFENMEFYREEIINPPAYNAYPDSESERIMPEKTTSNRAKYALHRLQFYVATLICHEAIRAINFAISHDTTEPCFRNHPHDNLGYAWEKEVLGGTLHLTHPTNLVNTLCFTDEAKPRHSTGKTLGTSPSAAMEVPTVRYTTTTTYWLVPMEYVSAIARQACWDQARSHWYNFEVLHIPKLIGLRVSTRPADQQAHGNLSKSGEGGKQHHEGGHIDKDAGVVGPRRLQGVPSSNNTNPPNPSPLRREFRPSGPSTISDHPLTGQTGGSALQRQRASEDGSVPRDNEEEEEEETDDDDDDEAENNIHGEEESDNENENKNENADEDVLDLESIDWAADGEEEQDGGDGGDDEEEDLPDVEPEDEEWMSPQHTEWSSDEDEDELDRDGDRDGDRE